MGIGHVAGRAGDGGEDVALVDLHPGPSNNVAISRRVLDDVLVTRRKSSPCVVEPPDRLHRAGQWLPGDGEHAVDIKEDAVNHGHRTPELRKGRHKGARRRVSARLMES